MADRYKGKLTEKQLKFVAAYRGNAGEAAKEAGYGKTEKSSADSGSRLLKHPEICRMIKERQEKEIRPLIATRHDREKFLTDVFQDTKQSMKDRLKALELLSKMSGDYTNKIELSGGIETKQPQVIVYLPDNGRQVDSPIKEQQNIAEVKQEEDDEKKKCN